MKKLLVLIISIIVLLRIVSACSSESVTELVLDHNATESESLPVKFFDSELILSELDVRNPVVKTSWQDYNKDIIGDIIVFDLNIIESNDELDEKEGYEWITVKYGMIINCLDNDLPQDIQIPRFTIIDYYNFDLNKELNTCLNFYNSNLRIIDYYGIEHEINWISEILVSESVTMNSFTQLIQISIHAPIGYDGLILTIYDSINNSLQYDDSIDGKINFSNIIDSNTLFFRLSREPKVQNEIEETTTA